MMMMRCCKSKYNLGLALSVCLASSPILLASELCGSQFSSRRRMRWTKTRVCRIRLLSAIERRGSGGAMGLELERLQGWGCDEMRLDGYVNNIRY